MLRALSLVAVRQQQHQPAQSAPLHFAGGNELVYHHLRAVGKIAELRFPQHQRIWLGGGVAIFKTQHRFFGQQGIDHHKVSLVGCKMLQWGINAFVPFHAILVMPGGMAMEERSAPGILPGEPHRITFGEQRGISKIFRHPPVQRQFTARHGTAIINDFLYAVMQGEVFRHGSQRHGQLLQAQQRHGGVHRRIPSHTAPERLPICVHLAGTHSQCRLYGIAPVIHRAAILNDHRLRFIRL